MPNTKSAIKALRQSEKRAKRNLTRKRILRDTLRAHKKLVSAGQKEEALANLPKVYSRIDRSEKVNLIKKNRAARMKSRITQFTTKSTKTSS